MDTALTIQYTYRLREDTCADDDGTLVKVYGIEVYDRQSSAPLLTYANLFTRRNQAEELIDLCNRLELDPIHLTDVVEDALVGEYSI